MRLLRTVAAVTIAALAIGYGAWQARRGGRATGGGGAAQEVDTATRSGVDDARISTAPGPATTDGAGATPVTSLALAPARTASDAVGDALATTRGAPRGRHDRIDLDTLDDPAALGLSPALEAFARIERKTLPTAEDRATRERLARDPALVAEAAQGVVAFEASEQQALARRRRMVHVDLLVAALAQGSASPTAGAAVERVLTDERWPESEPLEVRKALVGDRLELAQALARSDPAAFEALRAKAGGTRAGRWLAYVAGREGKG